MRRLAIALLTLVFSVPLVWGDSTLHIGFGAGTPCAIGCGGDPNHAGGMVNVVDIYQNAAGANPAVDPVLLILGVPNDTDPNLFNNSSIVSLLSYNPYTGSASGGSPGTWVYGAPGQPFGLKSSQGFQGSFTATDKKSVYAFLGLPGTNQSNNFTNWDNTFLDWQTQLGLIPVNASAFGVYVFSLHAPLKANGLLNITFATNTTMPMGTYIVAYGKDASGKAFSVPFTEAGLQGAAPEPGSLALLASCLVGIGLIRRSRRSKAR